MFKFQTTTVLNDASKIEAVDGRLTIKGLGNFNVGDITKVFTRPAEDGNPGSVAISFPVPSIAGEWYRVSLYVKLIGSNNELYANDMVFKGKPYVYEFAATTPTDGSSLSAKSLADDFVKALKYERTRFGKKAFDVAYGAISNGADYYLKVGADYVAASAGQFIAEGTTVYSDGTGTSGSLTLNAVKLTVAGEDAKYIDITEAELSKYNASAKDALVGKGQYEPVATSAVKFDHCVNPFGTYGQILKDLRLPTAENLSWGSLATVQDEMPQIGAKYDQYIIYICKNRGIMGGAVVGMPVASVTAHSIWVKQGDVQIAFTSALSAAGTTTAITVVDFKDQFDTNKAAVAPGGTASNFTTPITEPDVTVKA